MTKGRWRREKKMLVPYKITESNFNLYSISEKQQDFDPVHAPHSEIGHFCVMTIKLHENNYKIVPHSVFAFWCYYCLSKFEKKVKSYINTIIKDLT